MRHGRDSRGVTLVELMVVVAVIGVLSALFISRMAEARKDAVDGRAIDLLDQLRRGVVSYESKTGTFPMNMPNLSPWNSWAAQIEAQLGSLQLPRYAQVTQHVNTVYFVAGAWGHPYGMGLQPNGGRGGWWMATPYTIYQCPNPPWDTTGCQLVK